MVLFTVQIILVHLWAIHTVEPEVNQHTKRHNIQGDGPVTNDGYKLSLKVCVYIFIKPSLLCWQLNRQRSYVSP